MRMRRKDREVTDPEYIETIVKECHCCRLGFNDHGEVYIVPLSFGYERTDGQYVFYFHGAKAGRKYNLIQEKPEVGFEMDTGYSLVPGPEAADYTARFRSIIGNGRAEPVEDKDEKMHAMAMLMLHYTEKSDWPIPEKMLDMTYIFKLTVTQMSCKEHE